MKTFTLLAYNGCYTSGITLILDVFHIANRLWQRQHPHSRPLFTGQLVSPTAESVTTTSGLHLPVQGGLETAVSPHIILIPGCDYIDNATFIAQNSSLAQQCGPWLRQMHHQGAKIASCCSSAFLLAECGLLTKQTPITTTWWLADLFQQRYPQLNLQIAALILDHDQIISGGTAAYLDLAFYLVEQYADPYLALECARILLADANRVSQSAYMTLQNQTRHSDELVLKAQNWFRHNLSRACTLAEVTAVLNVSQRTLMRRFKQAIGQTPTTYLQNMRIETAKRLLETTRLPVEEIVTHVGYMDVSSFRRLFKRRTQLTPHAYRQKFAPRWQSTL